jgi:hypothetical protein
MPPQEKPDPAVSFRDSLQDLIVIVEKLSPYCQNIEDLVGMAQLALENDAQVRVLMKLVAGK